MSKCGAKKSETDDKAVCLHGKINHILKKQKLQFLSVIVVENFVVALKYRFHKTMNLEEMASFCRC